MTEFNTRLAEAEAQIDANIAAAKAEGKTVALFPVSPETEPEVYDAMFTKYSDEGYFIKTRFPSETLGMDEFLSHEIYW